MKIRIISKAGIFVGVFVIVYSFIQWQISYKDMSQLVLGIWMGVTICLFSYIYSFLKALKREFREIEEAQDKRYDILWNKFEEIKK